MTVSICRTNTNCRTCNYFLGAIRSVVPGSAHSLYNLTLRRRQCQCNGQIGGQIPGEITPFVSRPVRRLRCSALLFCDCFQLLFRQLFTFLLRPINYCISNVCTLLQVLALAYNPGLSSGAHAKVSCAAGMSPPLKTTQFLRRIFAGRQRTGDTANVIFSAYTHTHYSRTRDYSYTQTQICLFFTPQKM